MDRETAFRASAGAECETSLGLIAFGSSASVEAVRLSKIVYSVAASFGPDDALALIGEFGIERVVGGVERLILAVERGENIARPWSFIRHQAATPRALRSEDDALADAIHKRGHLPQFVDRYTATPMPDTEPAETDAEREERELRERISGELLAETPF